MQTFASIIITKLCRKKNNNKKSNLSLHPDLASEAINLIKTKTYY